MGARGKKHGSGRKAARSSGTTRVDPRQPPASQGDRVGEPRKKSLAQSFALWFPVTGVVLAIVVAIVVLPQWRARHTIVSRLDNALATHDFAAAQLILREPEAVELLLQQPYGRDNPHTALWTALEAIVDSRRVPRGKDIIEHLHVATVRTLAALSARLVVWLCQLVCACVCVCMYVCVCVCCCCCCCCCVLWRATPLLSPVSFLSFQMYGCHPVGTAWEQ